VKLGFFKINLRIGGGRSKSIHGPDPARGPPVVHCLSRQCGILNISQLYRPPRPVTRIALLLLFFLIYYGAEHYSRGHQLCSHLIVSQHFMEPEGSLSHSQELSTCLYPDQTNSVHITPSHLYKIHPNIIHPPSS
jgi:hypothetical protein